MQVLTNTDRTVAGSAALSAQVEASVEKLLGRFSQQITRVEVHLSEDNGQRSGPDARRCMMEARLEGRQPTSVTHRAATMQMGIDGAAGKRARAVGTTIEKRRSS